MRFAHFSAPEHGSAVMPWKSKSAMRMAVQGALVRCSQSRVPCTALADFAEELKLLGWSTQIVEEIERRVLRAMFGRGKTDAQDNCPSDYAESDRLA
jgi:hypothetical protein